MSNDEKNIIRNLICLWIGFSAVFYIQYFFQEWATKDSSIVIAFSDLDELHEFNFSSDLFKARCIYKYSFFDHGTFVCPVNNLTKSIQFQIRESITIRAGKIVLDYCTKRRAMISHLQKLREYVIEKNILSDAIDVVYFRDVAMLLYDYIDAIKRVSKIQQYINMKQCQE